MTKDNLPPVDPLDESLDDPELPPVGEKKSQSKFPPIIKWALIVFGGLIGVCLIAIFGLSYWESSMAPANPAPHRSVEAVQPRLAPDGAASQPMPVQPMPIEPVASQPMPAPVSAANTSSGGVVHPDKNSLVPDRAPTGDGGIGHKEIKSQAQIQEPIHAPVETNVESPSLKSVPKGSVSVTKVKKLRKNAKFSRKTKKRPAKKEKNIEPGYKLLFEN